MRGKTAKKLKKLALDAVGDVPSTYETKVVKRFLDPTGKILIEKSIVFLDVGSTRSVYQRLKKVWRTRKDDLNLIFQNL